MTLWRFSDGTTVHLGGEVDGASLFAQELRNGIAQAKVQIWPVPFEGVGLDVNDPALMDAWVRQEMARPYRRDQKLRLLEAPSEVPPLPAPPQDDAEPRDGVLFVY